MKVHSIAIIANAGVSRMARITVLFGTLKP